MSSTQTCGHPALRVVQIDSHILDSEIQQYIENELTSVVALLPVSLTSLFWQQYKEEIRLLICATLWSHRLLHGNSPGQRMMGIAYRFYSPRKAILHFIAAVVLPYAMKKGLTATGNGNGDRRERLRKIMGFEKLLNFIHHLYFLNQGGYSTFAERLLRCRAEYITTPMLGAINYTSLNRELLWHSFRDVMLLLLPLGTALRHLYTRWRARCVMSQPENNRMLSQLQLRPFSPLTCARCEKTAVIPVQNAKAVGLKECPHVFCYYCYDTDVECPRCGLRLAKNGEHLVMGWNTGR